MRLFCSPVTVLHAQTIALAGLLLIAANAVCSEIQSRYVSLQEKSCGTPSESVSNRYISRDLGVIECRAGVTVRSAPLSLFVVSSNERSWVDLVLGDTVWSSEDEIVYEKENQFGNFPNVDNAPAEIRMNSTGAAVGLIFRVTAQIPDHQSANLGASNVSRLFVLGFRESGICFLGLARDNTSARKLLDSSAVCRRLLKAERLR